MAKKNLRRRIVDALDKKLAFLDDGEKCLTRAEGKKLLQHNDPDVKALETKHPVESICTGEVGKVLKNSPRFLYEPYTRYERIENPDYKRHKSYSLAGILTGAGLLVTGLASFNYPLAYAGAALTIASFGYRSGQWWRNRKVDIGFEKVPSELEKKIIQEIHDSPDSIPSDYSDVGYLARRAAKKPGTKETDKELYVKRTHRLISWGVWGWSVGYNYESLHHAPRQSSNRSWIGVLGAAVATYFGACALGAYNKDASAAGPLFYAAGSTALATVGHYLGYIFSKKTAPAEYRKVGDLEEKVNAMQGMDGSMTPPQPDYEKESKYGKYLESRKKKKIDEPQSIEKSDGYPPDYEGPRD